MFNAFTNTEISCSDREKRCKVINIHILSGLPLSCCRRARCDGIVCCAIHGNMRPSKNWWKKQASEQQGWNDENFRLITHRWPRMVSLRSLWTTKIVFKLCASHFIIDCISLLAWHFPKSIPSRTGLSTPWQTHLFYEDSLKTMNRETLSSVWIYNVQSMLRAH